MLHKMYSKPQTRQKDRHDYPSDYGATRYKHSRGKHFSKKFGTNSDKCHGCGATRHNTREKQCPAWGRKCYKCRRENHFAKVCHAVNKMHFVKHEARSAHVNEPMTQPESKIEYNQSLYHTTASKTTK